MNMRKTGRSGLSRAVLRCCLLLLLLQCFAPMQLVLCHEEGQAVRLEQALNGQCVPAYDETCSDCSHGDELTDLLHHSVSRAGLNPDHSHC